MPSFRAVRITRHAISPRLAMRSLENIVALFRHPGLEPEPACLCNGRKKRRVPGQARDDEPADHSAATRIGSSVESGLRPSLANRAASAPPPAFGVVSSFSPVKIELAPARKHSACVLSDMLSRPADRRTMDLGIVMRATATVR